MILHNFISFFSNVSLDTKISFFSHLISRVLVEMMTTPSLNPVRLGNEFLFEV